MRDGRATSHSAAMIQHLEGLAEREKVLLAKAEKEAHDRHAGWSDDMAFHEARLDAFNEALKYLRGDHG